MTTNAPQLALYQNAILVTITLSDFNPSAIADEIINEAATKHGASTRAITARKRYITNEDLAPVKAAVRELRSFFRDMTLNYKDNTWRLLPTARHLEFVTGIASRQAQLETEAQKFFTLYEQRINDPVYMSHQLGTLVNTTKPISVDELRATAFKLEVSYNVIPQVEQIHLDNIDTTAAEEIKQSTAKEISLGINSAMNDIIDRIHSALCLIRDRANDPESVFRWALIENVESLLQVLPQLNFMCDTNLTTLTNELRESLEKISPKQVRKNDTRRKEVVDVAEDMINTLMTAFSPTP